MPNRRFRRSALAGQGDAADSGAGRGGQGQGQGRERELRPLTLAAQLPENAGVGLDLELLEARPPSHDEQGHSQRWSVEVTRNFNAAVSQFLERREFDFEDRGQFIRTCVLIVMDYVERIDPPKRVSNIAILKGIALENAEEETRRQYLESIDRTCAAIMEDMGLGLEAEASMHYARIVGYIRTLPKGSGWRRLYMQQMKKRFGYLAKLSKIAPLSAVDYANGEDEDDD